MESTQFAFVILLLGFVAYVSFFDIGRVGRSSGLINDDVVANEPVGPTIERIDP